MTRTLLAGLAAISAATTEPAKAVTQAITKYRAVKLLIFNRFNRSD